MSDRTIAPGPSRMRAAWRAGLRARARWLAAGLACLTAASVIDLSGESLAHAWAAGFDPSAPIGDLAQLLSLWLLVLAGAVAVVFLGALVLRNLGPVGRRDPDLPAGLRTPVFAVSGIVLAAFSVLFVLLAPVAAGAARAVDASDLALAGLWARWAAQLLGSVGLLLLVAGVAEHLVMRHGLWRDLHMTRTQAREQSRTSGGR